MMILLMWSKLFKIGYSGIYAILPSTAILGLFAEVNSVRILTVPTSGSYQVGQRVQFICEAEVQGNETITWNWLQYIYFGIYSRNDQIIIRSFWIYIRHNCLFSCAVVSNKSIDKARKL